jgi:hypothetical protein
MKNILIVFLILFSIGCKKENINIQPGIQQESISEPIQVTPKEIPFFSDGVINVTNILDIKDSPSIEGNVIGQSSFGDHFYIWKTQGSRRIENGILDLWYKISYDNEEWINALYLRHLPFFIASDTTRDFGFDSGNYNVNHVIIEIKGYRETDGYKELKMILKAQERYTQGVYFNPLHKNGITPLRKDDSIDLQEEYRFTPVEEAREIFVNRGVSGYRDGSVPEYTIRLLDSKFENLRKYVLEIENIADDYEWFINFVNTNSNDGKEVRRDGRIVYFNVLDNDILIIEEYDDRFDMTKIITINSDLPYSILTGVRVGNTKDDIILQFGGNYDLSEYYSDEGSYQEIITYDMRFDFFPVRISFNLINSIVNQIVYTEKWGK